MLWPWEFFFLVRSCFCFLAEKVSYVFLSCIVSFLLFCFHLFWRWYWEHFGASFIAWINEPMISSFFGLIFNQKITIGAVKPQLGKRALARPIVAGGSGGGARSESPFPPAGFLGAPAPLTKIWGLKLRLDRLVQTCEINIFENCKISTNGIHLSDYINYCQNRL